MSDELSHITQEMYKKNLELAERNKMLALLRKIDQIILGSLTNVEQIADQVTHAIITDTGIKSIFLYLLDQENNVLNPLSIAFVKSNVQISDDIIHVYYTGKISMDDKNNPLPRSIKDQKITIENRMATFFNQLKPDQVDKTQQAIDIKQFVIHPFFVRQETAGVIVFGLGEEEITFQYWKDFIVQLPEVISIAINNAILYNKTQETNEKLKELDRLKDEFVSIASHELRTPMTAIKSYIWLAINKSVEKLDDDVVHYLHTAYQSTERLLKLVEQMLTISRIEGKRLQLSLTQFDLTGMVSQLYNELAIKAEEKNINFKFQFSQKPINYTGDADRIRETIQNIIGNALKFTPENGQILTTVNQADKKIAISVFNSGSYIADEDMPKLFQKFSRLNQSPNQTEAKPGSGLGLYICKQIVEMHQGTISVYSEANKGTTFEITLPISGWYRIG